METKEIFTKIIKGADNILRAVGSVALAITGRGIGSAIDPETLDAFEEGEAVRSRKKVIERDLADREIRLARIARDRRLGRNSTDEAPNNTPDLVFASPDDALKKVLTAIDQAAAWANDPKPAFVPDDIGLMPRIPLSTLDDQ